MKCQSVNYNANKQMCELCDGEYGGEDGMVDGVSEWKNYGTPKKRKSVLHSTAIISYSGNFSLNI